MKGLKVTVGWDEMDLKKGDDINDKVEFENSIVGYIERFNSLPPVGLRISNQNCDAGRIEDVIFTGNDEMNDIVSVYINFD